MIEFDQKMVSLQELYRAAIERDWKVINNFLKAGGDINTSILSRGPKLGYTLLHFGAMRNDEFYEYMDKLLDHGANVNSVGEDGVQPLHLACLLNNPDSAKILLQHGAHVDLKLTKKVFNRYNDENKKWSDEFNSMTLLIFSVINKQKRLVSILLDYGANSEIKSINNNNKILPMYALDIDNFDTTIANMLVNSMKNCPEFLNAKDDNGWHLIHYLFCNLKSDDFDQSMNAGAMDIVLTLISIGFDINMTINNDPGTMLVNMAAYKSCQIVLNHFIEFGAPLNNEWRVLYYATLPFHLKNCKKGKNELLTEMGRQRKSIIECILESYTFRREFGLYVPEDELKLMNQLITENQQIEKLISTFKIKFIDALKKFVIKYKDKSLVLYDIVGQVFNSRKLKILIKDYNFLRIIESLATNYRIQNFKMHSLCKIICNKVKVAKDRRELIKKLEKIKNLRSTIPLPYEIVLIIVEFVDDKSLKKFINAFYK